MVGFLLVVRSRAGLGRREPRSGEVPEIRIEVDTTPPVVQLFAPVPDPQRANSLVLCWTATDKNLGSHPVHLEWAERREGPWINIASNLANTGRHSWQLPESLPVQVYLRAARPRPGRQRRHRRHQRTSTGRPERTGRPAAECVDARPLTSFSQLLELAEGYVASAGTAHTPSSNEVTSWSGLAS